MARLFFLCRLPAGLIFRYEWWVLAAFLTTAAITPKAAILDGDEVNFVPPINTRAAFQSRAPLTKGEFICRRLS